MSYFDIYKKRLNAAGTTSQERIQTSKEKSFSLFKEKSIYKKICTFEDKEYTVSLQPNKEYESKTVCVLLTEKKLIIPIGEILFIKDPNTFEESYWIVIYMDRYSKEGYNRYKLIEINRTLNWIDNNINCSSKVYLTGQMDKIIDNLFKINNGIDAYSEPEKSLKIIIPTAALLKKEQYLEIENEGWIVENSDSISVPGLTYAILKECLLRPTPSENTEIINSFWAGGEKNGN